MRRTTAVAGLRLAVRRRQEGVFGGALRDVPRDRRGRFNITARSMNVAADRSLVPNHDRNNNDNNSNLPSGKLIDFQVAAKIEGDESHIATVELRPGETLRAESGSMLYMTEGIVSKYNGGTVREIRTCAWEYITHRILRTPLLSLFLSRHVCTHRLHCAVDTKLNGASSAFSRMLTGQNLFLTDFRYEGSSGSGTVCLGTDFPSKILRFALADHPGGTLICQKGAYMASNPGVNIAMEFTKSLTAGFFGGQGFVLQKLSGEGDVLVKGGGTVVKRSLRDGETLRVTSGSIIAFESTIQYDVQMMPGIKNAMFGGEGLFVTSLQGPGSVWLQGMPPDRMIAEIARRVPGGGIGLGIPIGLGGGGGGGGGEGRGEATAGDAAAAAAGTDAAIDADRAATVASSGGSDAAGVVDADSPTALFGDAAPPDVGKPDPFVNSGADDFSAATKSTEPMFDDDSLSTERSSEPSFDDEFSHDEFSEGGNLDDGELFGDSASDAADNVVEQGPSIFSQLWDFFTDQSDR